MTTISQHINPQQLAKINCWIFDLDNSLYHPRADIFGQIDVKMCEYIQNLLACDKVEANRIQKRYFHDHGTTLAGLMHHHKIEPRSFLDFVHAVDLQALSPDLELRAGLSKLNGRRIIFTNGDKDYAVRVLQALGIDDLFEDIQDIIASDYHPKPQKIAYDLLVKALAIAPETALFVEDMAQNLKPAKQMGMATVWLNNGSERGDHLASPNWIDCEIKDLNQWLTQITSLCL